MPHESAPAIHLVERPARYVVELDELGWVIEVDEKCRVRPDATGRITHWTHVEGTIPETFRRDADLIAALIKFTFAAAERRYVFGDPLGDRRHTGLEAICEAANDVWNAGKVHEWIGRDN